MKYQNLDVHKNSDMHALPLESFMDQTGLGIKDITNQNCKKNIALATTLSTSLLVDEPVRPPFPLNQLKKSMATTSTSSQVI